MALDEVTQVCPVPVPTWLADSGGKGIQIITVAHGEAQLRSRWGADGARIIMDTSGTKICLSGISDTATLDAASALCGTTAMKETRNLLGPHYDRHDLYTRHPVMSSDMISQLPARYALCSAAACPPSSRACPWPGATPPTSEPAGQATPPPSSPPPNQPGCSATCHARVGRGTGTTPRLDIVPPLPSGWDDPDRYPWQ